MTIGTEGLECRQCCAAHECMEWAAQVCSCAAIAAEQEWACGFRLDVRCWIPDALRLAVRLGHTELRAQLHKSRLFATFGKLNISFPVSNMNDVPKGCAQLRLLTTWPHN